MGSKVTVKERRPCKYCELDGSWIAEGIWTIKLTKILPTDGTNFEHGGYAPTLGVHFLFLPPLLSPSSPFFLLPTPPYSLPLSSPSPPILHPLPFFFPSLRPSPLRHLFPPTPEWLGVGGHMGSKVKVTETFSGWGASFLPIDDIWALMFVWR